MKEKYLLVQSDELSKNLYEQKKSFGFNDGFVDVYWKKRIFASDIFNEFSIPKEHQKIIIKVDNYLFYKKIYELITGFRFNIWEQHKDGVVKRLDAYVSREPSDLHHIMSTPFLYNRIMFDTRLNYYSYSDVLKLLEEIDNLGYLKEYIDSITNILLNKYYEPKANVMKSDDHLCTSVKQRILQYKIENMIDR